MNRKIQTFIETFRGRQDVVPRYWKSKDGERAGYTPLCRNEWKEGVCQKPCRTCQVGDYIPLSDQLVLNHFKGAHILGVYPLLKDASCNFIGSDFDNHTGGRDPLTDVRAFYEVCQVQDIHTYPLRSKSGKGYHSPIFFDGPVKAWKARAVTFALLTEAGVIGDNVELSSFDRLFPNQDRLSGRGFGNLIALPFQGQAAKKGHTLFLDPTSGFEEPYRDQWATLASIEKVSETTLDELIETWDLKKSEVTNGTVSISQGTKETAKQLMACDFIKFCEEAPAAVPEPLWFALITNLVCVRPDGYSLCHELSKAYPKYTRAETDGKIFRALDGPGPHTCIYISKNGFDCKRECTVKAPAALLYKCMNGDPKREPKKKAALTFV